MRMLCLVLKLMARGFNQTGVGLFCDFLFYVASLSSHFKKNKSITPSSSNPLMSPSQLYSIMSSCGWYNIG